MNFITELCTKKGLTLQDADEHIEVEVTPADIRASRRKDATCCAFAVSCRRTEKAVAAYFFKSLAFIEYKDKTLVRYQIPVSVQKEIVSFDRSGEMDPGLYRLSPYSKRRKAKGSHDAKDSERTRKRRRKPKHVTQNVRVALGSYKQ